MLNIEGGIYTPISIEPFTTAIFKESIASSFALMLTTYRHSLIYKISLTYKIMSCLALESKE
jgi:hypothetical protein